MDFVPGGFPMATPEMGSPSTMTRMLALDTEQWARKNLASDCFRVARSGSMNAQSGASRYAAAITSAASRISAVGSARGKESASLCAA